MLFLSSSNFSSFIDLDSLKDHRVVEISFFLKRNCLSQSWNNIIFELKSQDKKLRGTVNRLRVNVSRENVLGYMKDKLIKADLLYH